MDPGAGFDIGGMGGMGGGMSMDPEDMFREYFPDFKGRTEANMGAPSDEEGEEESANCAQQ